jgi:hypothetical protein
LVQALPVALLVLPALLPPLAQLAAQELELQPALRAWPPQLQAQRLQAASQFL